MHYHIIGNIPEQENVCERAVFLHSMLTAQLRHLGKKQRTGAQMGALAFGWCNRASLLFGSRYSELGHCLRVAVLRTAYSGRQQSRFRHRFLMNCVAACVPFKHNCLDCKKKHTYSIMCLYWAYLHEQIFVLMTCIQMSGFKDIYIFSGDNIYSRKRGWILGLLSHPPMVPPVSQWSFRLSVYASIFTVNHTVILKMTIGVGNVQNCFWRLTSTSTRLQNINARTSFLLDVELSVCKHQGPSCCTRKMEESYHTAVKRETIHNIHSYSYELEYLLSGHLDAFQGKCWGEGAMLGSFRDPDGQKGCACCTFWSCRLADCYKTWRSSCKKTAHWVPTVTEDILSFPPLLALPPLLSFSVSGSVSLCSHALMEEGFRVTGNTSRFWMLIWGTVIRSYQRWGLYSTV